MYDKITINQEFLLIYATIKTEFDVRYILFSFEKEYYLEHKNEIKDLINLYKTTLKEPYVFNVVKYEKEKLKNLEIMPNWVVKDSETNKIYKYLDKEDVIKYKDILLHIKKSTEFLISNFRDILEIKIKVKHDMINYLYLQPQYLIKNKFKIDILLNDIKNLYPSNSYLLECEYSIINILKTDLEPFKENILNRVFIDYEFNNKLNSSPDKWVEDFIEHTKKYDRLILGEEEKNTVSFDLNLENFNLSSVKKASREILEMNIPLNTSKEELLNIVLNKLNIVKN